ncbi:hypothetical protein [Simplicispira psychrophila]|uniref:hypothetical protein n=1 Tax=Simplicispira psychrophila TaxID=80882 RepID=UPI000487C8B1|nr:hypothetical protein [Simplicispira psychrophila]
MKKSTVFLAAALCGSLWSHRAMAACYVVYDAAQKVVYRSTQPPVDLSFTLHETVPKVVPGGALVFLPANLGCEFEVDDLARQASQEPLVPALPSMRPPRAMRG